MNRILAIAILIFFSTVFAFAQEGNSGRFKALQDKIAENKQLATTDPDKAFSQTDDLLEQAVKEGYKDGELALLGIRCWYLTNNDLKKAIAATQKLQVKAEEYGSVYYKAAVHQYFSNIYFGSELPDKALEETEIAIKLFGQVNDKSKAQDIITRKVNVYATAAEVYILKKNHRKAVQMFLKALKETRNIEDEEKKRFITKTTYTNLGHTYVEFDPDSAEYYINKSLLLSDVGKPDIIQFHNYLLLGYVYKGRKEYSRSIASYKKAEGQLSYVNSSLENINLLYSGLSDVYKETDSLKQANMYLQKLQNSLLQHEQNKNKSLHKIIDDELLKEKSYSALIGAALGVIIVFMSVFLIRLYRKNRLLSRQEIVSEQYLKEQAEVTTVDEASLSRLIEMAKNDDEAFIPAFHSYFPNFQEKLRDIHPAIVPSEVEFCALLKLNLSTKDIARYKNIEPKSVQNKKYRIRKKLHIPDEVDIYFWFNRF